MASSGLLSAIISVQEFNTINETTREKIENSLKKYESDLESLKIQLAKIETRSEQQCFTLETQLQELRDQADKENSIVEELTNKKNEIEKELSSAKEKIEILSSNTITLETALQELKRERDAFASEKEETSSLLSRRNDDLDRLSAELRNLTDQLVNANKEKYEAIIKTEELNGKQLALEYKEKRLDQERELLIKQQHLLQEELETRTKELLNCRRDNTTKFLDLQTELAEKTEELRIALDTIANVTSTKDSLTNQIQELMNKLKEQSENELKMTDSFRQELRSQTRLCELYKASSEDAQAKADELTKATEELQRLLREASSRFGEMESNLKGEIEQLQQQLEEKSKAIHELQKELDHANTLLDTSKLRACTEETVETMSPSAAAASRLLKTGMSLTQIYSQYASVSEQLLIKEQENKRLNTYIDQILQEIEERAPSLARQREDYEKSLETIAQLTQQLEMAANEAESHREQAIEAQRQLGHLRRTNERWEKQVRDLGKQVCFLLKEVENLRGNAVPDSMSQEEEEPTSGVVSASQVISQRLVTFRGIQDLQHRNQELLVVLRELSDRQEEEEQNAVNAQTAKIQLALENALAEVEQLREARRRQEELVQTIVQQRDMYRMLVQEEGHVLPSPPSGMITSTPAASLKRDSGKCVSDLEKSLNEISGRLSQQQQTCESVLNEKKAIEKELNGKIDSLTEQLTEARSQNARLGIQIQYEEERTRLLEGNLDSYKKQVTSLEEKVKVYSCTVAKHEQSIAILRDEAMNAQQKLARAEVTVNMLMEEKTLLKDVEKRLLLEKEALIAEKRNHGLLQANLEAIKLNLERAESETKIRLQNAISALEEQCELLNKKLEMEKEQHKEAIRVFDERTRKDQAALQVAEEKLTEAESRAAKLQEALNAAESQLKVSSPIRKGQAARLLSTGVQPENDVVSDLRTQLAEARTEVEQLRGQLDLARQQSTQYREIADSMEEELKKGNEANQIFKQEMEQHIKRITNERNSLAQNLEQVQEQLKKVEEGAALLDQQAANQSEAVSTNISRLESELKMAQEKLKAAEESEAQARKEYLDQVKAVREEQEKYERELMQHAADVEQLNTIREQLQVQRVQFDELKQVAARLEEELRVGKSSWENSKEILLKESAEKGKRCCELEKQVEILQEQLVVMSTRIAAATEVAETDIRPDTKADDSGQQLNVSFGEQETRSAEQLMELVRFLRREKQIAISRSEVKEAETQRLKTELEHVERQLTECQAALQQEKERTAVSVLSSNKHTELLRKLETLNALTDSNRLLREEKVTLFASNESLTAKVTALEEELRPLRDSCRDMTNRIEELNAENQTLRKQVMSWKSRTTALQDRAGRVTADEVKRIQQDKELVQKQLDQLKENLNKTNSLVSELQRTNGQLITAQQKQLDENKKIKEEAQKTQEKVVSLQNDLAAAETKREEETAKTTEQANQLRRIARKYKSQYEELKVEFDKLTAERAAAPPTTAKEDEISAQAAAAEAALNAASQAKIKELEEKMNQLNGELDQLKNENQMLKSTDEKTKIILKNARQKIATLSKDKETLTKDLGETKSKLESLEQQGEENVRLAALRSQLEARLSRLERENSELQQAKQTTESDMETLNQRIPVLQRQIEAYQKQFAFIQQQQQQQSQQPPQPSKVSPSAEKPAVENPPTANIKPMASTSGTAQRQPTTPVQPTPGTSLGHRTTPTASIRPMAMPTRTVAVQPTSVSVLPMAPPVAVAIPTPLIASSRVEDVGDFSATPTPSTSTASEENNNRKRLRASEAAEVFIDKEVKRVRADSRTEEETEVVIESTSTQEEIVEEEPAKVEDIELNIDEESEGEGLIESDDEDRIEVVEAIDEEEGEEEEVEVEDNREVDEVSLANDGQEASEYVDSNTANVPTSADIQPVPQVAEEITEPEAFLPSSSSGAITTETHSQPAPTERVPHREDRLPSIGRNTLPYDDGGDDGIVPSTPVLLRPRTNDGFAEAVSSPQVTTRFLFGNVTDLTVPISTASGSQHGMLGTQGMEDTRMDLSQLEESTGRSVPSTPLQVSPLAELPSQSDIQSELIADTREVMAVPTAEEQQDLEGGPDLESDAAAELVLLGEDDGENDQRIGSESEAKAAVQSTDEDSGDVIVVASPETIEVSDSNPGPSASTSMSPSSGQSRPVMRRGAGSFSSRGRGMNRDDPRMMSSRPVPITWSSDPNPAQQMPGRLFRRNPMPPQPVMMGNPMMGAEPNPQAPQRARRGIRGRVRARRM